MGEKQVGVASLIAVLLWTLGGVIVVADLFVTVDLGAVGLMLVAGGMVMTNRKVIHSMCERERDVFQMGRDYQHSQSTERNGVRSLR